MKNLHTLFIIALVLSGCAQPHRTVARIPPDYVPLDDLRITSHFATRNITSDNLQASFRHCVRTAEIDSLAVLKAQQTLQKRGTWELSHPRSASRFLVTQTTGLCLKKSSNRQPIFAAEAFIDTVNPIGAPSEIVDQWYKELAMLIATKGSANVAYVYNNGNASIAHYWVNSFPNDYTLHYSHEYKIAGTWEADIFDTKFTHTALNSIKTTLRNERYEKGHPLLHRFKGNRPQRAGNPQRKVKDDGTYKSGQTDGSI